MVSCKNCDCEKCKNKSIYRTMKETGLKQCTKCLKIKELNQFNMKNNKYLRSDCIICRKEYNKQLYLKRKGSKQ